MTGKAEKLRFGRYLYDTDQRLLYCDGRIVSASPKVLETLEILLRARGRIVSKSEFMDALWPSTFVEESNLTQNIFVLRRTLGQTEAGEPYVETLSRRGYRLSVAVETVPEKPAGGAGTPRRRKTDLVEAAPAGTVSPPVKTTPTTPPVPAPPAPRAAENLSVARIGWIAAGVALLGLFGLLMYH